MNKLDKLYFTWLIGNVCTDYEKQKYSKMLNYLYNKEYVWLKPLDENLMYAGLALRDRFVEESRAALSLVDRYDFSCEGCSMLELLVSLSIRIERTIMINSDYGDRTSQWFWAMIKALKIIENDNEGYSEDEIDEKMEEFMDSGVLFCVKNASNLASIWQNITNWLGDYVLNDGEIW